MWNNNILAGTWDGLYLSTSGGTNWDAVTPTGIPADTAIRSLAMTDTTLFAGTDGGYLQIFRQRQYLDRSRVGNFRDSHHYFAGCKWEYRSCG